MCPLDLRAGIVEERWTPAAACLAIWVVAHLTPQEAEELFARAGGLAPSRSTLDRLPKALSERWEHDRPRFEELTRRDEDVPAEAVAVALSIDGIMMPMKDGKRAASRAAGKDARGPARYREAACGTLAYNDPDGDVVGNIIYLGRMPQKHKQVLEESLEDELVTALEQRPELRVVGLADGAKDNWKWLDQVLPNDADQVLDFYHSAEHLRRALDSAHGEGTPKSRAEFERLSLLLRDDDRGVDKVVNALAYQRRKHPRRQVITREIGYFRRNRKRMAYGEERAAGLPIGSGIVEAADKTLVTVRMKRAGARRIIEGGQVVLTFRALATAKRFDRAWALLANAYKAHVEPASRDYQTPVRVAL